MNFFYKQENMMDCGITCLRMVSKFYGKKFPVSYLRALCYTDKTGVTLLEIVDAAKKLGFEAHAVKTDIRQLKEEKLPCILHWDQGHFLVLYKIKNGFFYLADPATTTFKLTEQEFCKHWIPRKNSGTGVALSLIPGTAFYENSESEQLSPYRFASQYFLSYRKQFLQLVLGLGFGSLLQLIAPVLTQSVVDIGIDTRNINFVYLVLIAQGTLFIASTSVDFIRNWILLHISTRTNITILTEFLIKLMKLPVSYFETRTTGDIMQRMNDQQRIERFLTGSVLSTIFYIFNLLLFTVLLFFYNRVVFFITVLSTVTYLGWIITFLSRRRQLNYFEFDLSSQNQSCVVELVTGMKDIKLTNSEQQKRWKWEQIQAKLFKFKVNSLTLSQYQQAGSMFINQGKNIFITFLTVKGVIDGTMTIGGMIAVQYIIGMISNPVEQVINFIQGYQDAKISFERISEVYSINDEEPADEPKITMLPLMKGISIDDLSFHYPGSGSADVLKNVSFQIPEGKTTAIVGLSGSGKTTILKLLLRFFEHHSGKIIVGDTPLKDISIKEWRRACGTVMQDGFIFSDTIAGNIAVGEHTPDEDKLWQAIRIANLSDFVNELPFGAETKIGSANAGLSQGQKQRILIARAVYKDPQYLFFDEATNALDAYNETVIIENLSRFLEGKTVVIVAHRLSTVKNADNIIVIDQGELAEQGTHEYLVNLEGHYFQLVKNQLELAE